MSLYGTAICSMYAGYKIKVQGRTTQCANRFVINLEYRSPCDKSNTCPLHISVRFNEGCIVRNTHNHCEWGQEERNGGMPIIRGKSFIIELECKPQAFRININGCHFCDYKHRLPFDTINNMTVRGDVEICDVRFNDTPQPGCGDKVMKLIHQTAVPSMFPGQRIKVEGSTTQSSNRCMQIPQALPLEDNGTCLSPKQVRKLNSIEEININGCYFCDYKHRLPKKTVDILVVNGNDDVKIFDVSFNGTPTQHHCNDTMPFDLGRQPLC